LAGVTVWSHFNSAGYMAWSGALGREKKMDSQLPSANLDFLTPPTRYLAPEFSIFRNDGKILKRSERVG